MARLFGTNGVRGVVGETMTPELAMRLGRAIGTWSKGAVLVGRDTRTSGPLLREALVAGLAATGVDVVDAGVCPTPSLQYSVKHGSYGAGAVITASHNPPEFNGIKVVAPDGTELDAATEVEIERHYFDESFKSADWSKLGRLGSDPDVNERYIEGILDITGEDVVGGRLKVLLDCANGAACGVAGEVLSRMGAEVLAVNDTPDGSFPGHPSEPTPDNLAGTLAATRAAGCDLGIALDGDADRCVFITRDGGYVPGERSLALVAGALVEDAEGGVVVTPVSSSSCVEDYVRQKGGRVLYTAVGSPIVARVMMREHAVFGGEENGGLIFPEHQYCRDGTMTAAWVTAFVARTEEDLALHVSRVPRYHLVKLKVPCPDARKPAVLAALPQAFAGKRVDTTDGVKVFLPEGWVLVRPSGTEPLMRVFAESKDEKAARRLAEEAKTTVLRLIG